MMPVEPATDIKDLPPLQYTGEILLVDTPGALDAAAAVLRRAPVLGFDTETRPSFRKGEKHLPSLLQLALEHRVYLIQLKRTGLTPALTALLSDGGVVKAGVGVRDDIKALAEMQPFEPGGFADLAEIAKARDIPERGVRSLAARFLGGRLSKGAQTSNWAARELTERQKRYAAADAWVCLRLYALLKT
jgi:ribonuclease D